MHKINLKFFNLRSFLVTGFILFALSSTATAGDSDKGRSEPPVPVRAAIVEEKMVLNQIALIGTTEPITESIIAAEVPGVVEYFPVKEGDFVKKGHLLARLRSNDLRFRLKGAVATRDRIKANFQYAEKELKRVSSLKDANSISTKKYDEAFYTHSALLQEILQSEAEIERLDYEIKQKEVFAPFAGFIARQQTQIGEWINAGGAVVTMVNLDMIQITVDVPERHAVMLSKSDKASVIVKSISAEPFLGVIYAVLPKADPSSRTFPVRINLKNPDFKIKGGMEAMVTFNLKERKKALVVPKDTVVIVGNNSVVFTIADNMVLPVNVQIMGYYNGDVAVKGQLKPGDQVVIRGNERLRPGQAVVIIE